MNTTTAAAPPATLPLLRLRRGTLVQARGDGLVQVGSDPSRRALLPDTNAVRGTLHLLAQGVRLTSGPGTDGVVAALREAGVLLEPDVQTLLGEARNCTLVQVDVPAPWLDLALGAVRTAGLSVWSTRSPRTPDLLLAWGPPAAASPVLEHSPDLATLHVRDEDARMRVGPFVSPGDTACPECIEAHLRDRDQFRPLHVEGPNRSFLPSGATDVDELDALMVQHCLILAADDLRAWSEGRQPRTWSATLWVDRTLVAERRVWIRHPSCGCGWSPTAP